jgi:hypothetical protein
MDPKFHMVVKISTFEKNSYTPDTVGIEVFSGLENPGKM